MTLDFAVRLTEILLALAFIQSSLEHIKGAPENRNLFICRFVLSVLLLLNIWNQWVCLALVINALFILNRFQGPYNGGSDRMGTLILCCLCAAAFMPQQKWQEYAFGYLALQVLLSYFMAGWVKIKNPEWRNGQALEDVFRFSAYPVSESLRGWAEHRTVLLGMSWAVILFELAMPFTLLWQPALIIGLIIAATFHLANAALFGLNRFVWVWIAAYPSLFWLQDRILGMG